MTVYNHGVNGNTIAFVEGHGEPMCRRFRDMEEPADYVVLLGGANGYRTSHYPHSTATMDLLDEMGFLVIDETRRFESTEEGLAQLEILIKRDRNRPGVIFWSTGNEEPNHITDVGRRIHRAMVSKIRHLDPDRLILCAENFDPERSTVFADCDAIGINYNLHTYDAVHSRYPDKAILATECCSTDTTRDWYRSKSRSLHRTAADGPGAWTTIGQQSIPAERIPGIS
jgi:beta-galactosidase